MNAANEKPRRVAKIIVTLTCEYDGDDVDDYNDAMNDAVSLVDSVGYDLISAYEHVVSAAVEATG